METILHMSDTRGYFDHRRLQTYHTFSFADYRDEERIRFGMLRVLNDDTVAPGKGFEPHKHNNIQIAAPPLEGRLQHRDTNGHEEIISINDVRIMSAGTGIYHSEFNASDTKLVKLLQF